MYLRKVIELSLKDKSRCYQHVRVLNIKITHTSTLASRNSVRRFKVLDGNLKFSNEEKKSCKEKAQQNQVEYFKKLDFVLAGGGESAIIRHTKRNKKLLPRDRIQRLIDPDYPMLELCPFAGIGLDYGDICAAGNICAIAKISGQLCIIGANDATVKGGTVYPIGVKKQLRMQEIAMQNNLPCVYLIDSGGGFLPLQSEVFPGKEHGGRVFYNEAIMNSEGIPQICLVAGSCTAGAAYIPTMANEVVMVDKIGTIFLAGPPLVYAAIGQQISDQDLGGATVHCDVSGCADYKASDEVEALEMLKDVMSTLNVETHLNEKTSAVEDPFYDQRDLDVLSIARDSNGRLYIRSILSRVVDGSRFHEYKPTYGVELLTGFAHVNGILVGIVANNGMFTPQACLKGSNFVSICNERGIPIVFLQDISKDHDEGKNPELIKYQSEFMSAVATSKVPKITIVLGDSFGVGNYIMCGRSMGPRFLYLWPTAKISLDHTENMKENSTFYGEQDQIDNSISCYYGSGRIWDDGVILPEKTREYLTLSLTASLMYKNVDKSSQRNVLRM